jgi:hypothetical protein
MLPKKGEIKREYGGKWRRNYTCSGQTCGR